MFLEVYPFKYRNRKIRIFIDLPTSVRASVSLKYHVCTILVSTNKFLTQAYWKQLKYFSLRINTQNCVIFILWKCLHFKYDKSVWHRKSAPSSQFVKLFIENNTSVRLIPKRFRVFG